MCICENCGEAEISEDAGQDGLPLCDACVELWVAAYDDLNRPVDGDFDLDDDTQTSFEDE